MAKYIKLIGIVLIMSIALCGCTHFVIQKECKQVDGEELFVCKTLKPWE